MSPTPHEHIKAAQTPAWRDKHFYFTLLFTAIVTFNHKAVFALTPGEIVILGGTLGVYMGQSQLSSWAKLRELLTPRTGEPIAPEGK